MGCEVRLVPFDGAPAKSTAITVREKEQNKELRTRASFLEIQQAFLLSGTGAWRSLVPIVWQGDLVAVIHFVAQASAFRRSVRGHLFISPHFDVLFSSYWPLGSDRCHFSSPIFLYPQHFYQEILRSKKTRMGDSSFFLHLLDNILFETGNDCAG